MSEKNVDAVGLVRKIRDDIYEQTRDMSAADLVEFFRQHSASARGRLKEVREREMAAPSSQ